jgi:hypothetical protein
MLAPFIQAGLGGWLMSLRRLYFLPSGRAVTVVACTKRIFLRAKRIAANDWRGRLRTIDGWVVGVYAETEDSLWLYTALTGMWGKAGTGGLVHNLKRARDASVVYEAQWEGSGLRVALCDQDPAFEGGLGNLIKQAELFERGEIAMPPAIARAREVFTAHPNIEAVMLPASPIESNAMRLALARVLLIRPEALTAIEPGKAKVLDAPLRLLGRLLAHRAPDRIASLEDPPGRRLWVAPRLGFFLARRRLAQAKDWLRRVFVENPKASLASVREFLADLPIGPRAELLRSIGYLVRSLLEGWAHVLVALAVLIGALSRAGLL